MGGAEPRKRSGPRDQPREADAGAWCVWRADGRGLGGGGVPTRMSRVARRAGEYKRVHAPSRAPSVRFSRTRPKSDLDWTIHRAKQTPGPAHYAREAPQKRRLSQLGALLQESS